MKSFKMRFTLFATLLLLLAACRSLPEDATNQTEGTRDLEDSSTQTIDRPVSEMGLQEASENFLLTLKRGGNTDAYAEKFAGVPLETLSSTINTDDERKAFYINLYNAYIQRILNESPSLYDDRKTFFGEDRFTLAGKKISFDRLEHGIIRASTLKLSAGYLKEIFPGDYEKALRTQEVDPRIHFAVNCGAKDCPPVHILSPADVNAELDQMSKDYLNEWTTYDAAADTVATTSLMSWFRGDFGGKDGAVQMLREYGALPAGAEPELKFKPYDWTLKTGVWGE